MISELGHDGDSSSNFGFRVEPTFLAVSKQWYYTAAIIQNWNGHCFNQEHYLLLGVMGRKVLLTTYQYVCLPQPSHLSWSLPRSGSASQIPLSLTFYQITQVLMLCLPLTLLFQKLTPSFEENLHRLKLIWWWCLGWQTGIAPVPEYTVMVMLFQFLFSFYHTLFIFDEYNTSGRTIFPNTVQCHNISGGGWSHYFGACSQVFYVMPTLSL